MKIRIIKESKDLTKEVKLPGMKNPGAMVVATNLTDVVGPELAKVLGQSISFPLPTGHAYGAVVTPVNANSGKVVGFTFWPPFCSKPKDVIAQVLRKNPIPILTSMTVSVKSLGNCPLQDYSLTENGAKQVAQSIKRGFNQAAMEYAAFNNINPASSLAMVGSNGRCKTYSVIPLGLSLPYASRIAKYLGIPFEADADNCATFVVDALAAGGGPGSKVGYAQLITSPIMVTRALKTVAHFAGNV